MAGNVDEWVQDCWNDSYEGAPADGKAWNGGECKVRLLRGGSFSSDPNGLRAAVRGTGSPDSRGRIVGFRVAR